MVLGPEVINGVGPTSIQRQVPCIKETVKVQVTTFERMMAKEGDRGVGRFCQIKCRRIQKQGLLWLSGMK